MNRKLTPSARRPATATPAGHHPTFNRREILKTGVCAATAAFAAPVLAQSSEKRKDAPVFKISLAEWSLHRTLFAGKLDNLDFAANARLFGVDAVEYVNQFFMDKASDTAYLDEMKKRAQDNDVKSLLIMCDGEGNLGDPDTRNRIRAVENHYKWLDAA